MARAKTVNSDAILEAAERLFATQGFGATSLRQLIAECQISPTAFYARYPSKDAVLEALVERVLGEILAQASVTYTRSTDPERAAEQTVQMVINQIMQHKIVVRLALTEAPTLPSLRSMVRGSYTALFGVVRSYFGKRVPESASASWLMLGGGLMHLMRWAVYEEIDDDELIAELRAMTRLLATTFAGGAAPR
jgi:AcrR family transcriptional regulator